MHRTCDTYATLETDREVVISLPAGLIPEVPKPDLVIRFSKDTAILSVGDDSTELVRFPAEIRRRVEEQGEILVIEVTAADAISRMFTVRFVPERPGVWLH